MKIRQIAKILFSLSLCVPTMGQTPPQLSVDCNPVTIGYNLADYCYVLELQPGLIINLTVAPSDTSKLSVSPGAYTEGTSRTQILSTGNSLPYFYMQNLGVTSGSAVITLTAPGRTAYQLTVHLAPASFGFGISNNRGTVDGPELSIFVHAGPLNSSGEITTEQLLRPGLTKTLYIANLRSTVASVENPVPVSNTRLETTFTVTPKGVGTDVLCITQPKGFQEERGGGNELTIYVTE